MFTLIQREQLSNDKLFTAWKDAAVIAFNKKVRLPDSQIRMFNKSIDAAKQQYLSDKHQYQLLRIRQIVQKSRERALRSFNEDLTSIEEQLSFFKEIAEESKEDLYCGYFDDLLHLAGEFMLSVVCTRYDRGRQIRKGLSEGYHFGTLALQDGAGRVLGYSQVQVSKTPVEGVADSQNKGFHAWYLTGINLSRRDLPIEKEKAVMTILECARKLAKDSGMQGAGVAVSFNIHSNQSEVRTILKQLVHKGILVKKRLKTSVVLSKGTDSYSYNEIYFIKEQPDINLRKASINEQKKEKTTGSRLMPFVPELQGKTVIDSTGALNYEKSKETVMRGMNVLRVMYDNRKMGKKFSVCVRDTVIDVSAKIEKNNNGCWFAEMHILPGSAEKEGIKEDEILAALLERVENDPVIQDYLFSTAITFTPFFIQSWEI
jgi:hypothetical protein